MPQKFKVLLKRSISVFCLAAMLLVAVAALAAETVWIAASGKGKKYHYETCHTLRGGKKEIPISEARRLGYTGCGVCNR